MIEVLVLPRDASGFSPRECSRCKARFQVRAGRRETSALASALADRVEHLNAVEAAPTALPRHCPYCGYQAEPEAWWTAEQRRFIEEHARELRAEVRWRRLRVPWEALQANPSPTYLPVTPRPRPTPPPVPEGEEFVEVPLPCCGEAMKVRDAWVGPVRCHYCGYVHARDLERDIGLELALLRAWVPDAAS